MPYVLPRTACPVEKVKSCGRQTTPLWVLDLHARSCLSELFYNFLLNCLLQRTSPRSLPWLLPLVYHFLANKQILRCILRTQIVYSRNCRHCVQTDIFILFSYKYSARVCNQLQGHTSPQVGTVYNNSTNNYFEIQTPFEERKKVTRVDCLRATLAFYKHLNRGWSSVQLGFKGNIINKATPLTSLSSIARNMIMCCGLSWHEKHLILL